MKQSKLLLLFLFLCHSLVAEQMLSDASITICYSRRVELFPDQDFPNQGRFQLLDCNRSLTQWNLESSPIGKSFTMREFIRTLYTQDPPISYPADLVFSGKKQDYSIPVTISAPYYNRFTNTLTFDYRENTEKRARYAHLGKEARLVIYLDQGRTHEH